MQASECCIIRASIAAMLGGCVCFVLMLNHGVLTAIAVSPFAGSATAVGAVALFWTVSQFIPCEPRQHQGDEAVQLHAAE